MSGMNVTKNINEMSTSIMAIATVDWCIKMNAFTVQSKAKQSKAKQSQQHKALADASDTLCCDVSLILVCFYRIINIHIKFIYINHWFV